MRDLRLRLRDGRDLAYTEIGDPAWPCVIFFHGAPASRLRVAYIEPQLLAKGVRVVSPDRPGYGGSSPQHGRSMADWIPDVTELADALGIHRFAVAGHSTGGPYAVACAALLPERVSAGMVLGGVTDMGWPGAWKGYPETEIHLMRLASEESAAAWCLEKYGADGGGFMTSSGIAFPEPDERLYANEEVARLLAASRREAFRQGVTGYAQDMVVQGRPWPVDPRAITAPFEVVHGELDTILPMAHSRHTAELIPGSVLRVLPGHGHLTILGELPSLASALLGTNRV